MADKIRVRIYNVRFGDAILVTVPDRDPVSGTTTERRILIDVGNVLAKEGGADLVFKPVLDHIIGELNGKPIDLYVMTHEHLDHVQGLFFADKKVYAPGGLKQKLRVDHAWLTGSAAPDYYDTHPKAKKEKKLFEDAYAAIERHLQAAPAAAAASFYSLMANNSTSATKNCVEFLRNLAPAAKTFYVHRGFDTAGKHPFKEARFEIWAPEEDTSSYYKSLLPMAFAGGGAADAPASAYALPVPPPGVDAGAFYDLVKWRASGFADNILAIDKAANDTSVVFALEWRGKRLLFAGDAELKSWSMMHAKNVLKPVDFLKVSHHGSHNGTPDAAILDAFFPAGNAAKRDAVISTWDQETYPGIPHPPTNTKLSGRGRLHSTLDDRNKLFYDVEVSA